MSTNAKKGMYSIVWAMVNGDEGNSMCSTLLSAREVHHLSANIERTLQVKLILSLTDAHILDSIYL